MLTIILVPAANGGSLLAEIGRTTARPSKPTSESIDEGSPVRRISENLADALSKIGGITVEQPVTPGTLSVSLSGAAQGSTAVSVGGIQVGGAGGSTLQAVAADLATGVTADANGSISSIGGAVNFRTLEPTKTWRESFAASFGSYERTSAQASVSGSSGKLSFAIQHAVRGGDNPLTGLAFLDSSGLSYVHDGASSRIGDFIKLRYPISRTLTADASFLNGHIRASPICSQFVTNLPCGYGPGGLQTSNATLASLNVQGQIGNVTTSLSLNESNFASIDDEPHRFLSGIPTPYRSDSQELNGGYAASVSIAERRHTLTLSAGEQSGQGVTTSTGLYQGRGSLKSKYGYYALLDTLKFSDRWHVTAAVGGNQTLASSGSSATVGLSLTPSANESLNLTAGVFAGGASSYETTFFSSPSMATYNCAADETLVDGPTDSVAPGRTHNAFLSYQRRGKRGSLRVNASSATQSSAQIGVQVPIGSLDPRLIPPGYFAALQATWQQPTICGTRPFDSSRVFVNRQITTAVRFQTASASGTLVLGRSVIAQASYSILSESLTHVDARLAAVARDYAPGSQIPYVPVHRGSLLLDAVQRRANVEWVLNGSWVSAPNNNRIGPYVIVAGGVTWAARRGSLSLFENNIFGTYYQAFATSQYAQALQLQNRTPLVPVPRLLPPRTLTILYSVRAGAAR